MLRLDVTVVHQYFVGSVMNNRKKGIRLHHSLAGAKHFALLPALKRKKKTAFGPTLPIEQIWVGKVQKNA